MNLRFDKNQLRIRVLQKEASLLLDNKSLNEKFPFSNLAEPISIQVLTHNSDFKFETHGSNIKLLIPRDLLNNAIQNFSKDPVCRLTTPLQNQTTEILFEVDVFKKREDTKK